jgi:hypothetical protein
MHTDPVADCTTALSFRQEGDGSPESAAVVVLFARGQDDSKPYRTGYAYEWDARDGKERLWAAGQLLAERARPADAQAHTMRFALRGSSLIGRTDGQTPLEATDARFASGSVGFGAHGNPRIACDWYEVKRPEAGEPSVVEAIDVGGPFDVREPFRVSGEPAKTGFAIWTTSGYILQETGYGPHGPWYTSSRTAQGGMLTVHSAADSEHEDAVALMGTVLCLIASKGATSSLVRAETAGPLARIYPQIKYQRSAAQARAGTSLLVRVQDSEYPWAGCYSLTYDCEEYTLELLRYDQAGPPNPSNWQEPVPVKRTVLDSIRLNERPVRDLLWLSAGVSEIQGGIGDEPPLSALDATYPNGYVGYGARPDTYGAFRWVEMRGRPG